MIDEFSVIAAVARNGAIGLGGRLPWDYPEDRAHFERTTRGHAVIMGRRTWEERGTPLEGRTSIVISRTFDPPAGVYRATDLAEALAVARHLDRDEPFVIGGKRPFEEAMPRADRVYLTEIPESPEADTFVTFDRVGLSVVFERTTSSGLRFLVLERGRS